MKYDTELTYDIIQDLPNLSKELSLTDGQFQGLRYSGFMIIERYIDASIKINCGNLVKSNLTIYDKELLQNWKKDKYYIENYYRLDLEKYVFIFEYNQFKNGELLLGSLLEKSLENRMDLAILYQQYILRELMHVGL